MLVCAQTAAYPRASSQVRDHDQFDTIDYVQTPVSFGSFPIIYHVNFIIVFLNEPMQSSIEHCLSVVILTCPPRLPDAWRVFQRALFLRIFIFEHRLWSCPACVQVSQLSYAPFRSNANGLLPPSDECRRRGL